MFYQNYLTCNINLPYIYILKGRNFTNTVIQDHEVLIRSRILSKFYIFMHTECINSK